MHLFSAEHCFFLPWVAFLPFLLMPLFLSPALSLHAFSRLTEPNHDTSDTNQSCECGDTLCALCLFFFFFFSSLCPVLPFLLPFTSER
ncbi:hypothetical protein BDY21DRAFT_344020 [Lineolata rhizophorae]|uniref:Uncharacterized protein n=1 Tax=Lineolata rhizophorae TaxID=578093 RepID=A0A6A6P179_9PEZI|nr:hypothetical protein BDY21DRAFT_344020 [Lineolata rhizophorae]